MRFQSSRGSSISLHDVAFHCLTLHFIALGCISLHDVAFHCMALRFMA